MLSADKLFRVQRYIVFGEPVKNFQGGLEAPAVFKIYGKLPRAYNDYKVFTSDSVATFVKFKNEDEKVVSSAFNIGGIGGMKKLFFKEDVFDAVSKNFGISRTKLRSIIRASNSVELVPYFNIETKNLVAVLSKKKHRSVHVLNNPRGGKDIIYYSGARVYRFSEFDDFEGTLRSVLRGKVKRAPDQPTRVSVPETYCSIIADSGDWYMMFSSMFVMNNNVLVANKKNEMVVLYPVRVKIEPEAAIILLENGIEFLELL